MLSDWSMSQILAGAAASPSQSWNKAQTHAVAHWQRLTDRHPFGLPAAAIATGSGGIWVCCVFTAPVCVDTAAIATRRRAKQLIFSNVLE